MTHNRDSEVCIDQAIAGIVALGHDIVTCGESSVESFVTAMDNISSALALECNVENDSQREFLWTPCLPKFSESCAFAGIRPARTIALILATAGCWTLHFQTRRLHSFTSPEYLVLKNFSISARQSPHNLVASLTTSGLWRSLSYFTSKKTHKHDMCIWDQKKKQKSIEIHGPPMTPQWPRMAYGGLLLPSMEAPVLWRQGRRHGFEGGHHHRSELGAEDVLVSQGGVFDIHLEQNFLEIFWGVFLLMFVGWKFC